MATQHIKTQLTGADEECLNAARGLSLFAKDFRDKKGLKPSVDTYNRAIAAKIYTGRPIVPIGGPQ